MILIKLYPTQNKTTDVRHLTVIKIIVKQIVSWLGYEAGDFQLSREIIMVFERTGSWVISNMASYRLFTKYFTLQLL